MVINEYKGIDTNPNKLYNTIARSEKSSQIFLPN
jgi:hypothetical protein